MEWIFSTEPDVYPWSRVQAVGGPSRWDGIRGPLARLYLRQIKKGDRVWGYHSSPEKNIVCWARAAGEAYPDPSDEKWLAVDVEFVNWLPRAVPLSALRQKKALAQNPFLRVPRLSVAPLSDSEVRVLENLINDLQRESLHAQNRR